MIFFKNLLTILAFAASATSALAQNTIDQNAPANNTHMAAFAQGALAQSFQQSAANISGAGIFLRSGIGRQANVTISLWDSLPNAGGTQLAMGSTIGTAGTWADVFWSPVSTAPAMTYYLVFSGNNTLGIAGDTNNGYVKGQVFANSGYRSYPTYDYTFRTFTAPVPEPETYALMLVGLGMITGFVRRRKNNG